MATMQEMILQMHLGHDKIIGSENGLPVRSMIIPSEHSNAFIRSGAKLLNSMRYGIVYPGMATLAITGNCNCACTHCIGGFNKGDDISAKQWIEGMRTLSELGVFVYLFLGGEPMMKEDLPEIISGIDQNKSIPVVFTNGSLIEERIDSLKQAGLNRVFVSIDYASEKHDKNRNHKGLFTKICRGIEAIKRRGMMVGLSTYTDKERFENGSLQSIIDMASEYKVDEVFMIDSLPAECVTKLQPKTSSDIESEKAIDRWIEQLWQSPDAPGIYWYKYVRSINSCGCFAGRSGLHISNNGDINPCFSIMDKFGNITEGNIKQSWLEMNRQISEESRKLNYKCLYTERLREQGSKD